MLDLQSNPMYACILGICPTLFGRSYFQVTLRTIAALTEGKDWKSGGSCFTHQIIGSHTVLHVKAVIISHSGFILSSPISQIPRAYLCMKYFISSSEIAPGVSSCK